MAGLIILLLVIGVYFFPTIVAESKKRPNSSAILILNLFLGWTLVGWVVALVWALSTSEQKPIIVTNTSSAQELEKLAELKTKGVITEAEFEAKKKKILES